MERIIKLILIGTIVLLLSSKAFSYYPGSSQTAADGEDFFSEKNERVYAHIHYAEHFETRKAGTFYGHITTPTSDKIKKLKVYLHSLSHPQVNQQMKTLEIVAADGETDFQNPKLFYAARAWFHLKGHWLIIMEFHDGGQFHRIEIPVHIVR